MVLPKETLEAASAAARQIDGDVFLYNGPLQGALDLGCIQSIYKNKSRENVTLFLTTNGGDPDAAYKIARYFQEKYKSFTVVVSGKCKSAGTLLAIGAREIAFTPYGELGPLDIQLSKVDKFDHLESGLAIKDSLDTLQRRAVQEYMDIVQTYIRANNGLLSFAAATDAASKLIGGLYGPVFSRVDPEEVGAKARSMRIAIEYGKRLSARSQNLAGNDTLKVLAETYPSHSFVIDEQEASLLFKNVRHVTDGEMAVVSALGTHARFDLGNPTTIHFHALSEPLPVKAEEEKQGVRSSSQGSTAADVPDSPGAGGAALPTKRRRNRSAGVRVRGGQRGRSNGAADGDKLGVS